MSRTDNIRPNETTEPIQETDEILTELSAQHVSSLQSLQKFRIAKHIGLKREIERLTNQHGENDLRVIALSQKLEADIDLNREIGINLTRAKLKKPEISKGSWLLHGLVLSKELKGVPNLTVGLYSQNGKWIEQLGYACTDAAGYFKLTHKFKVENTEDSVNRASETAASAQLPQVFIRLQEKTGALVYTDKHPIIPTPGRSVYREIVIGDEPDICMPPKASNQPPT